jgi:hypothetical protein
MNWEEPSDWTAEAAVEVTESARSIRNLEPWERETAGAPGAPRTALSVRAVTVPTASRVTLDPAWARTPTSSPLGIWPERGGAAAAGVLGLEIRAG